MPGVIAKINLMSFSLWARNTNVHSSKVAQEIKKNWIRKCLSDKIRQLIYVTLSFLKEKKQDYHSSFLTNNLWYAFSLQIEIHYMLTQLTSSFVVLWVHSKTSFLVGNGKSWSTMYKVSTIGSTSPFFNNIRNHMFDNMQNCYKDMFVLEIVWYFCEWKIKETYSVDIRSDLVFHFSEDL